MNNSLWLAQLFTSEEDGVTNDNNDLADETEPELIVCQRHVFARSTDIPDGGVGEDIARTDLVWSCSSVIRSTSAIIPSGKITVKTYLASMTTQEPMNCASANVTQTCSRERVCNKTMPKPTPWIASRTPSQSHVQTPM